MAQTRRVRGVLPAVPTPFREERVALELMESLIQSLARTGLAGFLILGSNGEAFSLSDGERRDVLRAARRAIPKEKFFLAGCGAESLHVALERVLEAAEAGADAALVLTPHYLKGSFTADGYIAHYERLAEASPIPIYIYNIPQFTGVSLEISTLARLSRHPNIHGMKDSSGNLTFLTQAVSAASPNFDVFCGSDKILASALLMGAKGAVLALANVAPERCVELYTLCEGAHWNEAATLQRDLVPVGTAVTTRFGVPGLKAGLRLLDHDAGDPRLPLLPLGPEGRAEIGKIFRHAGLLT